jgi:hypothetical protein
MVRLVPLSLLALAVALYFNAPVRADDQGNTHDGKFVLAEGANRFIMTAKDGTRHEHTLAPDAKVTCDGRACKLSDLKEGIMLRVTTEKDNKNVATNVEARTKGDFDKNK